MENFNAEEARNIAKNAENKELFDILKEIQAHAELGKTEFGIFTRLTAETITALIDRGFSVKYANGVPDPFCVISWW